MSNASSEPLYPGLNLRQDDPSHRGAEPVVFGFWVFLMSDLVLSRCCSEPMSPC